MKEEYLTSEAERRYRKRYYEEHREEILRKRQEKYRENREHILEYQKRYSMTHDRSAYFRRYRAQKQKGEKNETEQS